MAVWQFNITVIPRKELIEKYGLVPDKLFVDLKERQQHQKDKSENKEIYNSDYQDVLTQNWWYLTDISAMEIVHQMDKLVRRANYGSDIWISWKTYIIGDNFKVDNDASLDINDETGKIRGLSFRADLREPSLVFLNKMMELAQLYDWVFMDTIKGFIAHPNKEEVGILIENSNAFKFLQNPRLFLEDIVRINQNSNERKNT
jgi:hypothetical protein